MTRIMKCPTAARHEGDLVGCGSTNIAGPDDEGLYDCAECGLWFRADAAEYDEVPEETTNV